MTFIKWKDLLIKNSVYSTFYFSLVSGTPAKCPTCEQNEITTLKGAQDHLSSKHW